MQSLKYGTFTVHSLSITMRSAKLSHDAYPPLRQLRVLSAVPLVWLSLAAVHQMHHPQSLLDSIVPEDIKPVMQLHCTYAREQHQQEHQVR